MKPCRPSHIAISKMVAAMVSGPQSIEDLVEASGLCVTTVRHYVLTLRKEKAVRVAEWQADRRGHLSVAGYAMGNRPDAPKPVRGLSEAGKRWKDWESRKNQAQVLRLIAA